MSIQAPASGTPGHVLEWRRRRLLALGLSDITAEMLAGDCRVDLHVLLDLVDRGCAPELAVRILAPLDDEREQ
jgi:hypothetical protein